MKRIMLLFSLLMFLGACSGNGGGDNTEFPEIPLDPGGDISKKDMPVQMWVDAHVNLGRFEEKSNITMYLQKMQGSGVNEVYLDVKPNIGYALYDSDILPQLTKWGSVTVNRTWDYLGVWIEEAEKLDMKVIACLSVLGFGDSSNQEGLVYDESRWDGKTQMKMNANNPNDIVDIRNQSADGVMLNPCLPEVQTFVISIIEEIITKYPKISGVCLDYCRWWSGDYGMGDATIAAFQASSGITLSSRNDIITATGGIGPHYKDWIEFRSMTITNLITNIRSRMQTVNPDMELILWASAHWKSRYSVGQNWASKTYVPAASSVYTSTYSKTGFADQLDAFSMGAYADAVWKSEAPASDWSVENFVTTYSDYIKGDCKVYGSIATYAYGTRYGAVSDAIYLCLKNTDGLMLFELSHVINNNQWDAIKEGVDRVIKK